VPIVVGECAALERRLLGLAGLRMVFLAGLPGTGKSLLAHQLAHLAHARGRRVHLLQWDLARPVFEATDAGRRHPVVDGVTPGVIRKAVGLWARRALAAWDARHPDPAHLLIGEAPLVGSRFIELARPAADGAEALLAAAACRFVIPVPSREVRRFLEGERERRAARPLHPREREDAPPEVLRDLWRELHAVARALGIAGAGVVPAGGMGEATTASPPYDPAIYQRVYEAVLRHRHFEVLSVDTVLATADVSVYAFAIECGELTARPEEADALIREVEARYPDGDALEREIARWWVVPSLV
jgi:hypothetical protein